MITLKGRYKNRKITLNGVLPSSGEYYVFITFFKPDDLSDEIPIEEEQDDFFFQSKYTSLLTDREKEILKLMQTGSTNTEIADLLEISDGTTRNYTSSIYSKLKVRNRTEAIYRGVELGIIEPIEKSQ